MLEATGFREEAEKQFGEFVLLVSQRVDELDDSSAGLCAGERSAISGNCGELETRIAPEAVLPKPIWKCFQPRLDEVPVRSVE
jgi:hypothetical protein